MHLVVMIGSNYPNWADNTTITAPTTTKVCLVRILRGIMKVRAVRVRNIKSEL